MKYLFRFKKSLNRLLMLVSGCLLCGSLTAQNVSPNIRLNQIGFYPNSSKIAVLAKDIPGKFMITSPDLSQTFFTGELSGPKKSDYSTSVTRLADFSSFTQPGTYVVYVPEVGYSYQFEIKPSVNAQLATGLMKSYYYQRLSMPLAHKYAGKWSRPAGHPDDKILVHPSAISSQRAEGTVISSPKGWYDAGDYNKYIVNSGITMGTMLSLYEEYPDYCKQVSLNIPESNNKIPDLLDELLYNLRWMLTMQDPSDGGVYHKLTNPGFDGFIMPAEAKAPRYVVQKTTAAACDFAAVMAQSARILKNFRKELPGLADSCLHAAQKAWDWAMANPNNLYRQNEMNTKYSPQITTGEYGDFSIKDEFIWAASELYVTTRDDKYYTAVNLFPDDRMPVPSWGNVKLLGYYTLLRFEKNLTPAAQPDMIQLKKRLAHMADELLKNSENNAYATPMCKSARNFVWGSNSVAANQGIALIQAYRLTQDKKYLMGAIHILDYVMGRNATGYSYVTGFGTKTPMFPHHRPSGADQIPEPVPGLVAGGPNPGKEDKCDYPSSIADEAYVDVIESYASNEVAINWNSPMVYLVWSLEATFK